MSPLQQVHAVPFARLAHNAQNLGGVAANAYAQTGDLAAVALSGDVADLTGSFGSSALGAEFVHVAGDTMQGDLDFDLHRLQYARM